MPTLAELWSRLKGVGRWLLAAILATSFGRHLVRWLKAMEVFTRQHAITLGLTAVSTIVVIAAGSNTSESLARSMTILQGAPQRLLARFACSRLLTIECAYTAPVFATLVPWSLDPTLERNLIWSFVWPDKDPMRHLPGWSRPSFPFPESSIDRAKQFWEYNVIDGKYCARHRSALWFDTGEPPGGSKEPPPPGHVTLGPSFTIHDRFYARPSWPALPDEVRWVLAGRLMDQLAHLDAAVTADRQALVAASDTHPLGKLKLFADAEVPENLRPDADGTKRIAAALSAQRNFYINDFRSVDLAYEEVFKRRWIDPAAEKQLRKGDPKENRGQLRGNEQRAPTDRERYLSEPDTEFVRALLLHSGGSTQNRVAELVLQLTHSASEMTVWKYAAWQRVDLIRLRYRLALLFGRSASVGVQYHPISYDRLGSAGVAQMLTSMQQELPSIVVCARPYDEAWLGEKAGKPEEGTSPSTLFSAPLNLVLAPFEVMRDLWAADKTAGILSALTLLIVLGYGLWTTIRDSTTTGFEFAGEVAVTLAMSPFLAVLAIAIGGILFDLFAKVTDATLAFMAWTPVYLFGLYYERMHTLVNAIYHVPQRAWQWVYGKLRSGMLDPRH